MSVVHRSCVTMSKVP